LVPDLSVNLPDGNLGLGVVEEITVRKIRIYEQYVTHQSMQYNVQNLE
jgi:hypothetical protein